VTKWRTLLSWVTKFGLRLLLLTFVHLMGFILAAQLVGVSNESGGSGPSESRPTNQQAELGAEQSKSATTGARSVATSQSKQLEMFGAVLLVCLLNSCVLLSWMLQTSLHGVKLAGCVFVIFFSCMTVMPQSETFFFFPQPGKILRLAGWMGLVVCGLFSVAAVPILNRWRKQRPVSNSDKRSDITFASVWWRLVVSAGVYLALYLLFGYFVAWQNPDVRSLYGGGELRGFMEHVTSPSIATRLIPFQLVRGMAWTLLCLMMIRFSIGGRVTQAIIVGLVLSVVMNAQLFIPNPLMSQSVRMSHLVETAISNFLFGVFCVLFWSMRRKRHVDFE